MSRMSGLTISVKIGLSNNNLLSENGAGSEHVVSSIRSLPRARALAVRGIFPRAPKKARSCSHSSLTAARKRSSSDSSSSSLHPQIKQPGRSPISALRENAAAAAAAN